MGFFDSAQEVLDKGVSAAKGAVSGVAVEQQAFMKGFVRLCNDGWNQGWHERNGGNLTYRMTPEEVSSCRTFFYDAPSSWVALGVQADDLRGEFFAVTGSGTHLHNVALDPDRNAGIVEINSAGDAWRIVWGLKGGGVPTSEFPSHFLCHAVRKRVTNGANRVVYHAHPTAIGACTLVLPADARVVTRALWKSLTEGVIAFPAGVGVLPWMVPGSSELAQATSRQMGTLRGGGVGAARPHVRRDRLRRDVRPHAGCGEGGGRLRARAFHGRRGRAGQRDLRRRHSRDRGRLPSPGERGVSGLTRRRGPGLAGMPGDFRALAVQPDGPGDLRGAGRPAGCPDSLPGLAATWRAAAEFALIGRRRLHSGGLVLTLTSLSSPWSETKASILKENQT